MSTLHRRSFAVSDVSAWPKTGPCPAPVRETNEKLYIDGKPSGMGVYDYAATVQATVTNTGDVDGAEVAQVSSSVSAPTPASLLTRDRPASAVHHVPGRHTSQDAGQVAPRLRQAVLEGGRIANRSVRAPEQGPRVLVGGVPRLGRPSRRLYFPRRHQQSRPAAPGDLHFLSRLISLRFLFLWLSTRQSCRSHTPKSYPGNCRDSCSRFYSK